MFLAAEAGRERVVGLPNNWTNFGTPFLGTRIHVWDLFGPHVSMFSKYSLRISTTRNQKGRQAGRQAGGRQTNRQARQAAVQASR